MGLDFGIACSDPFGGGVTCPGGGANKFFVGFVGLNNGDGTGSMDSWWSHGNHD
jgi:hypothetical protein